MDKDTADELANLYELLSYICQTFKNVSVAVDALVNTVGRVETLAEPLRRNLEVAQEGATPRQLALLLQTIQIRVEALRQGRVPPKYISIH